jgi:hypothetical protein
MLHTYLDIEALTSVVILDDRVQDRGGGEDSLWVGESVAASMKTLDVWLDIGLVSLILKIKMYKYFILTE